MAGVSTSSYYAITWMPDTKISCFLSLLTNYNSAVLARKSSRSFVSCRYRELFSYSSAQMPLWLFSGQLVTCPTHCKNILDKAQNSSICRFRTWNTSSYMNIYTINRWYLICNVQEILSHLNWVVFVRFNPQKLFWERFLCRILNYLDFPCAVFRIIYTFKRSLMVSNTFQGNISSSDFPSGWWLF